MRDEVNYFFFNFILTILPAWIKWFLMDIHVILSIKREFGSFVGQIHVFVMYFDMFRE